jgi:hypothetical protein
VARCVDHGVFELRGYFSIVEWVPHYDGRVIVLAPVRAIEAAGRPVSRYGGDGPGPSGSGLADFARRHDGEVVHIAVTMDLSKGRPTLEVDNLGC